MRSPVVTNRRHGASYDDGQVFRTGQTVATSDILQSSRGGGIVGDRYVSGPAIPIDWVFVQSLLSEAQSIDRQRIEELERSVVELRAAVAALSPFVEPHPHLPKADAKAKIKALFQQRHGEVLFPDDVAEALSMDLGQAIELCEELAAEGQIAERG